MNMVRKSTLCMLLIGSNLAFGNPMGYLPIEQSEEVKKDVDAWTHAAEEKLKTAFGVNSIAEINQELIAFLRKNAQEIAKEIVYLLEHPNTKVQMLMRYEFDKLFASADRYFKQADLSKEQSLATLLQNPQAIAFLADSFAFWNAMKGLLIQMAPEQECPVLHYLLLKTNDVEALYAGLFELAQKHAEKITIPAASEKDRLMCQNNCAIAQRIFELSWDHTGTDECRDLLKSVVLSWAAFAQDTTFMETLKFNEECRNKGEFDQQKPVVMPESFMQLSTAGQMLVNSYAKALEPLNEEMRKAFGNEYDFDEDICSECSACEGSCDDYEEYDFNEQFKRAHQ